MVLKVVVIVVVMMVVVARDDVKAHIFMLARAYMEWCVGILGNEWEW